MTDHRQDPVTDALAYLRDDAPYQVCDRCGRKSWAVRTDPCGMPQPDGSRCTGTFRRPMSRITFAIPWPGGDASVEALAGKEINVTGLDGSTYSGRIVHAERTLSAGVMLTVETEATILKDETPLAVSIDSRHSGSVGKPHKVRGVGRLCRGRNQG